MALFCLKANAYAIWEGPFNSTWEDTGMFRFLEQAYLKSYKIRNKLHSSETVFSTKYGQTCYYLLQS